MTTDASRSPLPDLLTVVAIAVVAYAAANVFHEAVGHGGACLLLGGEPEVLSSVHFECGDGELSPGGHRGVSAAGTIVNFIVGGLASVALRRTRPAERPHRAYFLWLFATLNFLMGAGYFLFSGVGNIGDWAAIARGTMSPLVWRPAMALFGTVLYMLFAHAASQRLGPLVGNDHQTRARCARLAIPAYFAGGLLYCVSGLFNPHGPILIAISAAAASFGGASGLLWLTYLPRRTDPSTVAASVDRQYGWIAAGCVAAFIFIAVLGPSVRF